MSANSPFKYDKWIIYFYSAVGFAFSLAIIAIIYFVGDVAIGLGAALFAIASLTGIFTLMGWSIARQLGTIFTFEVDHPVNLNNLIPGHTYWLNGETGARFIGVGSFTGKYHFHIEGYNSDTNRDDFTAIFPGNVRKYISMKLEPH